MKSVCEDSVASDARSLLLDTIQILKSKETTTKPWSKDKGCSPSFWPKLEHTKNRVCHILHCEHTFNAVYHNVETWEILPLAAKSALLDLPSTTTIVCDIIIIIPNSNPEIRAPDLIYERNVLLCVHQDRNPSRNSHSALLLVKYCINKGTIL